MSSGPEPTGTTEPPEVGETPGAPEVAQTPVEAEATEGTTVPEPVRVDAPEPARVDEVDGGVPAGAEFRTAIVSGITVDLPNQHPTVVLRESESPRRQLSFQVGLQDGMVLSHVVRRIPTPRPLTHELLSGILASFEIDVVAVRLVGRRGSVYFAELDLRSRNGRSVHSCRPSDALAIALSQSVPAPVLVDVRLLENSGDVLPGTL